MRRNQRQRAAACLLALLAQAGFIALFMPSHAPRVAHEDDSRRLIFIRPVDEPESFRSSPRGRRDSAASGTQIVEIDRDPASVAIDTSTEAPPPASASSGIETSSGIDWYGEMESVARSAAEKQEERELNGDPLDSKPRVMDIPPRPRKAGDEERYPDGAVKTWLSERCYVILDPASLGPGAKKICKESTLAEKRAEARRKELEKALMPGYLSRPLPRPPPATITPEMSELQ